MTRITVPDTTIVVALRIDELSTVSATFDHPRASLVLDRDFWEELGRPDRLDAPLVTRLLWDGPIQFEASGETANG